MKNNVLTICLSLILSYPLLANPDEAVENSAIEKITNIHTLLNELTMLNNEIRDTTFQSERQQQIATMKTQLEKSLKEMKIDGKIVSHEYLSGWKSGFFGARYLICEKIEQELRTKKNGRFHILHRNRKEIFQSDIASLHDKCDAEGKILGNKPIDQSYDEVKKNIQEMVQLTQKIYGLF